MNDNPASKFVVPAAEKQAAAGPGPPGEIRGYEVLRRLGGGAYGEVWVAMDRNTGRRVAIKFFTGRARHDPSLLPREIEKLVALSADRTIVQLFEVGWDADPPYYVMEYLDSGSLEDRLRRDGPFPVAQAVELFREIVLGVSRAHAKGVLHCDLKPANILLDQDLRPRLADFGQARLTHEQRPALGTLFYMAPEQADLKAVPDAAWDIYALGAIFYCMLTGAPPYRDQNSLSEIESAESLEERLHRYRSRLRASPPPTDHRKLKGMDRTLADIINRCLAPIPSERYPHVASLQRDLELRDRYRRRMPLMLLGLIGPLLLLATMGFFARRAYLQTLNESRRLVHRAALESNRFAAQGEARNVANELEQRFRFIDNLARRRELLQCIKDVVEDPTLKPLLQVLASSQGEPDRQAQALSAFLGSSVRQRLDDYLTQVLRDPRSPTAASWLITDARGVQLASVFREPPAHPTVGRNFAYRSYFHGGGRDYTQEDCDHSPLSETQLSTVFQSQATKTWKVAISTPIVDGTTTVGVLAMTVELGEFVRFPASKDQCALLVDGRDDDPNARGVVLEHPLYQQLLNSSLAAIPDRFSAYRVDVDRLRSAPHEEFEDPLATDVLAEDYRGKWTVGLAEVEFEYVTNAQVKKQYKTGLLALVQSRVSAANRAVENLARSLFQQGVAALTGFVVVVLAMWLIVVQMLKAPMQASHRPCSRLPPSSSSIHQRETVEQLESS